VDHVFQRFFFLAEFLRAFGIVPDLRVFQGGIDFSQAVDFDIKVKDTPEGRQTVFAGPADCSR
jgi:hypothetical protein